MGDPAPTKLRSSEPSPYSGSIARRFAPASLLPSRAGQYPPAQALSASPAETLYISTQGIPSAPACSKQLSRSIPR